MKHTTSRMLFAYWDALRGERSAPERADVQPGAMRHILADTFVIGVDETRVPAFRLAGTRVCALFARDLKDVPLHSLWPDAAAEDAGRLAGLVMSDTVGIVAGGVGTNVNGSRLPLELLLLPLRHRGRTDARMIGSLSPATLPSWAGLVPLRTLSLSSVRVIEPAERERADGLAPAPSGPRDLFVVHEGGRA